MKKLQNLEQKNIDIRPLEQADIQEIVKIFSFAWTTPEKTLTKWQSYYTQHVAGERFVCLVTCDTRIVGYGSLLPESAYKPFEKEEVFEINDIWIAPAERRKGLATLLITYFESIAQDEQAPYVGMGVGLNAAYAAMQQACVRLGYMPDGQGMTYKGIPVVPGASYSVDDALRLWFIKDLSFVSEQT